MPDLSLDTARHSIIDRRPGHYLSFPDIAMAADGRLFVVYREADKHVPSRSRLLLKWSDDQGRSWQGPRLLNAHRGHCPRITRLKDDSLVILVDLGGGMEQHISLDNGCTWASFLSKDMAHSQPDRVVELSHEQWLTSGHVLRGSGLLPETCRPFQEQMVYFSETRGQRWKPLSVMALEPCLSLCEASMILLPDGCILALLREDTHIFEPMYLVVSTDNGQSWSDPKPTPLIGHRPTLGLTSSGKLLVTYRNVAPDKGTAAFLGDLDDLCQDFAVHGLMPPDGDGEGLEFTSEGMLAATQGGLDSCLRYALRPVTDPAHARVELEVEVRCLEGSAKNACGVYCGFWWRILPDSLKPDQPGARALKLPAGQVNRIRFFMQNGRITVYINNRKRHEYVLDKEIVKARPIVVGNAHLEEHNAGKQIWKSMRLLIEEPRQARKYEWKWSFEDGLPDAWARTRILQLAGDRKASAPDFGYSGWVEVRPGEFLCAYHHGGGGEEGYKSMETAHVQVTRFFEQDFSNQP